MKKIEVLPSYLFCFQHKLKKRFEAACEFLFDFYICTIIQKSSVIKLTREEIKINFSNLPTLRHVPSP